MLGPGMVIVEELRQLLPQAFVALAFVTENDGAFEEVAQWPPLNHLRQDTEI